MYVPSLLVIPSQSSPSFNSEQVSPPSTITHITGPFAYIGSQAGDSQTIRILPEAGSDGSHIKVLENYINIGPIVDAILVDPDGSGQVWNTL